MKPSCDIPQYAFVDAARGWTPPFRGEIWENAAGIPMGRGYSNDNQPFDINTACYLKEPMRAVKNPAVNVVVCQAAVQTLKTFGMIDEPTAYFVEHETGDLIVYLPEAAAATDHMRGRLGPRLKSIPGLQRIIEETMSKDRFDITTTEFYLPGKILRVWPLNLTSTQRNSVRFVLISDAFMSGKTGMIAQAKARTTQFQRTKEHKIIIESQGGEEGDDFDTEWKATNMGMLHVKCPLCGSGQPFEFHRQRGDDFQAVLTQTELKGLTEFERAAAIAKKNELLLAPERRNCGFKRGPDELIKTADGEYNEREVLKHTYYECFYCGGSWHDTPATRKALDESSYYVASNHNALPENVGFSWPAWCGQRIPWGGELVMLGYLRAKAVNDKFGNVESLKQWYQKRAARAWSPNLTQTTIAPITGSYEVKDKIPDESCRVMFVDCQQDDALTASAGKSTMGHFWYVARAIDRHGNMFQLARGYATSAAEWQDVQHKLQISNENVGIDAGNWREQVIDLAAQHIAPYNRRRRKHGRWIDQTLYFTYTALAGEGKRTSWRHPDGRYRSVSQMQPQSRAVTLKGQRVEIKVPLYQWSNLSVKDQLSELVRGGEGRAQFKSLGREQLNEATRLKETSNLTYENQMAAEYRTSTKAGKPIWEKHRADNHYWDCECGCLVLLGLGGFLGIAAAPETAGND